MTILLLPLGKVRILVAQHHPVKSSHTPPPCHGLSEYDHIHSMPCLWGLDLVRKPIQEPICFPSIGTGIDQVNVHDNHVYQGFYCSVRHCWEFRDFSF